jgi:hypothetical protein
MVGSFKVQGLKLMPHEGRRADPGETQSLPAHSGPNPERSLSGTVRARPQRPQDRAVDRAGVVARMFDAVGEAGAGPLALQGEHGGAGMYELRQGGGIVEGGLGHGFRFQGLKIED